MVECVRCCASSHLQCVRLTQRTAKKVMFQCHRCKGLPVNKPSISKSPVTKPSVSGKTRGNLGLGGVSNCFATQGRQSSRPPQRNLNVGPSQAPLIHPPVSITQISTTCSQAVHPPSSSSSLCPSAPLSQPLPLGTQCSSVECASTPIVQASAPTIDNHVYSEVGGVLSNADNQSIPTHSNCITKAEVSSMLAKMESLIMAFSECSFPCT